MTELIQKDMDDGTIPRGPGGRIRRKDYARCLGISKSAMTHYSDVFEEFERLVGIGTQVDKVLSEVKALFLDLLGQGTLEIVNGVVARMQLLQPFGLWGASGPPKRHKGLRALFVWCDKEAKRQGYLPPRVRNLIEKCVHALSTGEFDDPSTGKVKKRALDFHLGIPGRSAYPDYLRDIVERHESAIMARLGNDPLVRFLDDRPYSLRAFAEQGWSEEILTKLLGDFFAEFSDRREDAFLETFNALTRLLSTISNVRERSCREVFRSVNERVSLAEADKSTFVFLKFLQTEIYCSSQSTNTVNKLVDATNRILALFARKGLLNSAFKIDRKKSIQGMPRPTILELHAKQVSPTTPEAAEKGRLQALIEFAQEKLQLANADVVAHLAKGDADAFLETLRDEYCDLPQAILDDPVKAMLHIINARDKILRTNFLAHLEKWGDHFRRGQELLKDGIDPDTYWSDDFVAGKGPIRVRDVFPKEDGERHFSVANLLRLVRDKFDGFIPTFRYANPKIRRFFLRLCNAYGGREFLMAYLFPHNDLVGSLISLYLMDSGANVAVGLSLAPDCIRDSDEEGYRIVLGNKEKADGKPIVIFLEERGDALGGMLGWQAILAAFSYLGSQVLSKFFFAIEKGGKIQPAKDSWYLDWFKRQTGSLPHFQERNIYVVPSSLRPTILMKAVLDHGGRIRHAITLAQHTTGVSSSYYARFPILLMFELEQRRCHEIMETIAVHSHPDGHSFIGVSTPDFDRRLEDFEPTGFGLRCGNHFGHPKRDGRPCETFDCWRCDNGILIVDPEEVATLIQWDHALAGDEGDWVRDHPERWNEYFLGWQIFIDIVEETMQQPHLVDIWDAGKILAATAIADPMYRPLRPWN